MASSIAATPVVAPPVLPDINRRMAKANVRTPDIAWRIAVGRAIQAAVKAASLSNKEAAAHVGVDDAEFGKWLNGTSERHPHLDRLFTGPSPLVLETEIPSINGLFSAHGLAKLYAMIANQGQVEETRLLSPTTVRALSEVQTRARDAVIAMRMNWRMGYHRAGALGYRGDSAFGHYGFGGSGGWADPATGLALGFVTNDLRLIQAPVGGDPRIFRLSGLVLRLGRELVAAER